MELWYLNSFFSLFSGTLWRNVRSLCLSMDRGKSHSWQRTDGAEPWRWCWGEREAQGRAGWDEGRDPVESGPNPGVEGMQNRTRTALQQSWEGSIGTLVYPWFYFYLDFRVLNMMIQLACCQDQFVGDGRKRGQGKGPCPDASWRTQGSSLPIWTQNSQQDHSHYLLSHTTNTQLIYKCTYMHAVQEEMAAINAKAAQLEKLYRA